MAAFFYKRVGFLAPLKRVCGTRPTGLNVVAYSGGCRIIGYKPIDVWCVMKMWWKTLIFVVMSAVIVFSFVTPAPQQQIGEASRIFYYHIPMAWICVIAFAMAMVYSIRYLKTRNIAEDDKAAEAARLGLIFCALAAVLLYGAYFALRGAIEVEEKKAALAAAYAILAFITVPFLIFVMPRVMPSLHPNESVVNKEMQFTMGVTVRWIFAASLAVFTLVFLWIFNLARRVSVIRRAQMEREL
jgi:heme exporter protein C